MKMVFAAFAASFLLASGLCAQGPIRLKARGAGQISSRTLRRPPGQIRYTARGAHYILQFTSFPGAQTRRELERRGVRVLQYVPDSALMVSSVTAPDLNGLEVTWAGPLQAVDKISPVLAEQVSGALLVVFHGDVDMEDARTTVRQEGFDILENSSLLPGQLVVSGDWKRIGALAASDEVAYILPASPDLAVGISAAGCAGALTEAGPVGEYVLVGRGWPKDSSGSVALKYYIRSLTAKLDQNTARGEIERALREWTRYANFTLSAGGQEAAERSIDILFASGAHGDSYPFDGPGKALAHTFYPAPPNPETLAGDMHLDAGEAWSTGADVDLFSVALHEAGHALGLGHSDRPGSVMYPYYRLLTGLTDDDIAGIRSLYGSNVPAPTQPLPTLPLPTLPPVTPPAAAHLLPSRSPATGYASGSSGPDAALIADQVARFHHRRGFGSRHRDQRNGRRQCGGHSGQVDELDGWRRNRFRHGELVGERAASGGHQYGDDSRLRRRREFLLAGGHRGSTLKVTGFLPLVPCFFPRHCRYRL